MLDIHYELQYPSNKVSDSLKEAHNRLTQQAKQLIERYIRFTMAIVDWSKATMKDICEMCGHVAKDLNVMFSIFYTDIDSTIVSGRVDSTYPKQEYTLTPSNTWDTFNLLDDKSYNRLKFIIRPVNPTNIKDFFNNRKNFVFVNPEPVMAFPESEPSSLLDDNPELMECDENIIADRLISTDEPKEIINPYKMQLRVNDGINLYGSKPLIEYEFDAPLAPIK
jgi:hypothetical protein